MTMIKHLYIVASLIFYSFHMWNDIFKSYYRYLEGLKLRDHLQNFDCVSWHHPCHQEIAPVAPSHIIPSSSQVLCTNSQTIGQKIFDCCSHLTQNIRRNYMIWYLKKQKHFPIKTEMFCTHYLTCVGKKNLQCWKLVVLDERILLVYKLIIKPQWERLLKILILIIRGLVDLFRYKNNTKLDWSFNWFVTQGALFWLTSSLRTIVVGCEKKDWGANVYVTHMINLGRHYFITLGFSKSNMFAWIWLFTSSNKYMEMCLKIVMPTVKLQYWMHAQGPPAMPPWTTRGLRIWKSPDLE